MPRRTLNPLVIVCSRMPAGPETSAVVRLLSRGPKRTVITLEDVQ